MYSTSSTNWTGHRPVSTTPRDRHVYDEPEQVGLTGKVEVSSHFREQALAKGFTSAQITSAIRNPEKVTRVTRYPHQLRYCGAGVAVVADDHCLVTVYADGTVTALRPDQLDDPTALASVRAGRGR